MSSEPCCLFEFSAAGFLLFLCHRGTEEIIHIRLHRVNQASFFFQLGAFVIKALLLVREPLLFGLQRFQARQFSVALYGEKSALCRLIDDKLCFVFGTVCRFVRRLHIGIINRFEPLVVRDVFDKRLHLTQSGFNIFQLTAGAGVGAVNVLDFLFKVSILQKVVLSQIVESTRSLFENGELRFVFVPLLPMSWMRS